jgi:hypothetical protein
MRSRVESARKRWLGKAIVCFTRGYHGERIGPYAGIVIGISDNQVAVEAEGGRVIDATGLLVEIPKLGRNHDYGEWPVRFGDVV